MCAISSRSPLPTAFFTIADGLEVIKGRQLALPAGHHAVLQTFTPDNVRHFVDEDDTLMCRVECQ